ncbi:HET-domain-containing protein [Sporormia fimetaria CBS 119925]|uniref:HET-domain-containing protein n=1 Tax=Sporormia fimetaria CBS 119925 TaxID=1340428 RepID=A0A6A6VJC5_9PLEO|nr:HET-domain-containing protein [Sporormia fimetaria CBS 119925]
MAALLPHHVISSWFWDQFPIGTRLNWTFLAHQLNQNETIATNAVLSAASLLVRIVRPWPVLAVPLFTGIVDLCRDSAPQGSPAARIAYFIIALSIAFSILAVGMVSALVITVLAMVILPIIAVMAVVAWVVVIFTLFFLWLALYRYPAYEVIFPAIRARILLQNSKVYESVPLDYAQPSIRVIRLRQGRTNEEISSELITVPLSDADFEALSYVWGTIPVPYKIQVNNTPFYITYNLHCALKELRFNDRSRLIWIDAICINQADNTEKSVQVQMMRDIYAQSSRVIIWLGKETKATASAFDFVRRFSVVEAGSSTALWEAQLRSNSWRKNRREFAKILRHEWWTRAWILQEVVVGSNVVMQRGSNQVRWEALVRFLTFPPILDDEYGGLDAPQFAKDIEEIRSKSRAEEPISNSLLGLAFRFRFQAATFGSDKIYSLLGLLPADNTTLIEPDYSKTPEEVFLEFAISCIENNKNLTVIALAAGAQIQGASWCRDWRFTDDGMFPVQLFSTMRLSDGPPPYETFSASASHPPIFTADLKTRVLNVQGYIIGTVARAGDFLQDIRGVRNWEFALQSWEQTAGGPWSEESDLKAAFDRTITAGRWSGNPVDWRSRVPARNNPPKSEQDQVYMTILDEVCVNRRFFVTEEGEFGLGPWNLKKGDSVCLLLGGKAPFVLRTLKKRSSPGSKYHELIGDCYLEGHMIYEGDMESDLQSGKRVLSWYAIV